MKGNQHLNGLTFILAVFHFIAMYLYKYLSSDVIFWNVNGKENKIFHDREMIRKDCEYFTKTYEKILGI